MRIIALLGYLSCAPSGPRWARQHLGSDGAERLQREALAWLKSHRDAPEVAEVHCPSPRVLIEVSDYVPYQLSYPLAHQDDTIESVDQVRCLVLYTHKGPEMAHHPETHLSVEVIDRKTGEGQRLYMRDHEGAFEQILSRL